MNDAVFSQIDFGPLKEFLEEDNITDVSYSNGGQVWLKTLDKGVYRVERPEINNALMEKLAFQCSNVMGKTFNMAHPFLDAESAELRLNFVHESIATNGICCVIRKTPAKIRLNKDKLINEKYVTEDLHDFLMTCVEGHCNIIVSGETGSGKTELVKYLASHTKENEKIITIEDTLELHLDKIFPILITFILLLLTFISVLIKLSFILSLPLFLYFKNTCSSSLFLFFNINKYSQITFY